MALQRFSVKLSRIVTLWMFSLVSPFWISPWTGQTGPCHLSSGLYVLQISGKYSHCEVLADLSRACGGDGDGMAADVRQWLCLSQGPGIELGQNARQDRPSPNGLCPRIYRSLLEWSGLHLVPSSFVTPRWSFWIFTPFPFLVSPSKGLLGLTPEGHIE